MTGGGAETPVGWGILGCGWVARDHVAPAIEAAPSARLVAVADPDRAARARMPGTAHGLDGIDGLLAEPGVEAVYIATPNDAHASATAAAARAGRAVLCEKPMASTVTDARAMVAAVEAAGTPYATAYDQRHHPAHARLRGLVAEGALGTITQVRIHYACWLPPGWAADNWRIDPDRAGGGAVVDLAPHGLDLLACVLGEQPRALSVLLQRRVQSYGVDDGGLVTARFPSGVLASLHVGYNCPDTLPRRRLELIGTRGMALAENTMGQDPAGRLTLFSAEGGDPKDVPFDTGAGPFPRQIEAFSRHLRHGGPPVGATPRGDLALTEMLLGALARAEEEDATDAA